MYSFNSLWIFKIYAIVIFVLYLICPLPGPDSRPLPAAEKPPSLTASRNDQILLLITILVKKPWHACIHQQYYKKSTMVAPEPPCHAGLPGGTTCLNRCKNDALQYRQAIAGSNDYEDVNFWLTVGDFLR